MFRDRRDKSVQTRSTLRFSSERKTANGSSVMAKGQVRSNREAKKPKQPKKLQPGTTPSGAAPIRVAPSASAAQKKN
jgi:hypothetical protein